MFRPTCTSVQLYLVVLRIGRMFDCSIINIFQLREWNLWVLTFRTDNYLPRRTCLLAFTGMFSDSYCMRLRSPMLRPLIYGWYSRELFPPLFRYFLVYHEVCTNAKFHIFSLWNISFIVRLLTVMLVIEWPCCEEYQLTSEPETMCVCCSPESCGMCWWLLSLLSVSDERNSNNQKCKGII